MIQKSPKRGAATGDRSSAAGVACGTGLFEFRLATVVGYPKRKKKPLAQLGTPGTTQTLKISDFESKEANE